MRRIPWLLLAALVVCACGGEKERRSSDAAIAVSTPARTATAGAPGATSAATPGGTPAAINLASALLTQSDLPSGWSAVTLNIGVDDAQPCGQALPLTQRAVDQARADFEKVSIGPFVTHSLASYAPGTAAQAMADTAALLTRCREWKANERGSDVTIRVSPLAFPALGEATLAFQVEIGGIADREGRVGGFLGGLLGARTQLAFVRRGDVVLLIAQSAVGVGSPSVDLQLTEQLARAADARLGAAVR